LQPGGHRFDPGQLHQKFCGTGAINVAVMHAIVGLGVWLVPISAILVWGIIEITKMILRHNERIAKIERGIDPDGPWPQQK
jgi:hypothetical protein